MHIILYHILIAAVSSGIVSFSELVSIIHLTYDKAILRSPDKASKHGMFVVRPNLLTRGFNI